MKTRAQSLSLEALEDRSLLATCTVTNLLDVGRGGMSIGSGQITGDLRFCINNSNASPGEDLIIFAVDGVIHLNRALPGLTDDLIIAGPGAANLTVRRAGPADYRIFTVPSSVAVQIYGLTIADGRSTFGGGIRNDGTLTIADSVVTGNLNPKPTYFYGVGGGGGIYNNGALNLLSSTISGNFARSTFGGNGGGIYNEASGVAVIGNSNIVNNTADGTFAYYTGVGGGISNLGSLTIFSSNISNNLAHGHEVSNGNAHSEGGGIFNKGDLTVDSSTIASNDANTTGWCNPSWGAGGYGAGISNHGTAIIANSTISTNDIANTAQCDFSATYGGGIFNRAGC